MAVFAISVTKEVPWRGSYHPVSNVYHYKTNALEEFDDQAAIDRVVALEKAIYATTVNFRKARTWGPTDQGQAQSKMRAVSDLSGTGALTPASNFYGEFAVMMYWPLGRYGTRNRPQYLRKWHHLDRSAGLSVSGLRFTGAVPAELATYMAGIESLDPAGVTGPFALCTADGEHVAPLNGGKLYPYLEHRQIGR